MMTHRKYACMAVVMLGAVLVASSFSPAASVSMPEFGGAVQFDNNGPFPILSRMRGKAVLVVFFQSSSAQYNKLASQLFQEVQESYGDDRSVVTMAVKTDGGGLSAAAKYMTDAGADLSKWRVGSDAAGRYYKYVTGKDEPWNYVLVGPKGEIVKKGSCGAVTMKRKFMIAQKEFIKECGELETVLPKDKTYAPNLRLVVDLAEMRYFSKALSLATSAAKGRSNRQAAEELKADILKIVETAITKQMDVLIDPAKDWGARYEAHKELTALMKDFRTVPAAKEANALLTAMQREPALLKEKAAETAYDRVADKLPKASARYKQLLAKELDAVAKKHPDTKYGKLAAEQAEAIRSE